MSRLVKNFDNCNFNEDVCGLSDAKIINKYGRFC